MAVPEFQLYFRPFLEQLADGQVRSTKFMNDSMAERHNLSDSDRAIRTRGGSKTCHSDRTSWATTYLKKAGLIAQPSRGFVEITEEGRRVLKENPPVLDTAFLRRYECFRQFEGLPGTPGTHNSTVATVVTANDVGTPDEAIESAYQEIRKSLAAELLAQVSTCSPTFFEHLVITLLRAMGYGGSFPDSGKHMGRSGDGGIDGLIAEDKLGLDTVAIQAKRWSQTVGRPEVQAFAGSMEAFRAKKGVLITTSSFSADARQYVRLIERKIVLVDGERLAELMMDHDVGVSTVRNYAIKRIDSDFFEDDA